MFMTYYNDLNSFIETSRLQRGQSLMANTTRATSLYLPRTHYGSQSETNFYSKPSELASLDPKTLRSLSPDDLQKMKYKIELDKQVAEKQKRLTREWERKIERDRKYVQHQAFGRHDRTTVLKPTELEEILSKGRAPSPVLDMPQQYPLHQQQQQPPPQSYMNENYMPNDNNGSNMFPSSRQSMYNQQPPPPPMSQSYGPNDNNSSNMYPSPRPPMYNNYQNYAPPQPQTQPPPPPPPQPSLNNPSISGKPDFQRFYGPYGNGNSSTSGSTGTTQPIKGDAHDPFLLFDPNKEGQNVFNVIPQQDLYDPWGRPGAGAPLIHAPTGQKFTRYSGSLQDKLNHVGPLGFFDRQRSGNIDEQKRDLESEQRRRQQEEMEHRSNAGDTAEWITQLERSHYPLKLHLATTQPTREFANARTRYRSEESRVLHDDLVRQADERARVNKLDRYQSNVAELQHSQAMDSWWGRGGGGAPAFNNRRHNVSTTFEKPRQTWTTNHLGQLIIADQETPAQVKVQPTDSFQGRSKQLSNHRNYYQVAEDQV